MKSAKAIIAVLCTCLSLTSWPANPSVRAENAEQAMLPFENSSIQEVMKFYGFLTHRDTIIATNVPSPVTIRRGALPVSEAVDAITSVLRENYGIIITNLNATTVSVTYNDQLPTKPKALEQPAPSQQGKRKLRVIKNGE